MWKKRQQILAIWFTRAGVCEKKWTKSTETSERCEKTSGQECIWSKSNGVSKSRTNEPKIEKKGWAQMVWDAFYWARWKIERSSLAALAIWCAWRIRMFTSGAKAFWPVGSVPPVRRDICSQWGRRDWEAPDKSDNAAATLGGHWLSGGNKFRMSWTAAWMSREQFTQSPIRSPLASWLEQWKVEMQVVKSFQMMLRPTVLSEGVYLLAKWRV